MEHLDENALNIYTDGSEKQRPRRGGYAFRIVTVDGDGHEQIDDNCPSGAYNVTNQQMELKACVEALKYVNGKWSPFDLSDFSGIVIYTDSKYVHDNLSLAKYEWPRTHWTRRGGAPILNDKLWRDLVRMIKKSPIRVDIKRVKGKSSPHTKAVDKLAKKSAEQPFGQAPSVTSVRRKLTSQSVEAGSVRPKNQEIYIRLLTVQYLGTQRCWRFKYEVMSEDSPYFGKVDFIFSDELLTHRNIYKIRMNDNPEHPQVEEVLETVLAAEFLKRTSA